MFKTIQEMLAQGKSIGEITMELSANPNLDAKEIAMAIATAEKALKVKSIASELESKQAEDAKIEARAKELADAMLKAMPVKDQHVEVIGEVKEAWREEVGRQLFLIHKAKSGLLTDTERTELQTISEKAAKINSKTTNSGFSASTAADAGYLIRREFEAQIDELVYKQSALLDQIKFKSAQEKIAIHGVGEISLTFRTNDDTNITKTKPTTTEDTGDLKDAGAIVPVSNRALKAAYYQIPSILAVKFASAKIKLLEPVIVQGLAASDTFNGVHFTTGITTVTAKNSGGSGLICSADLTNLYLASQDEISDDPSAAFVMRKNELFILKNEKDKQGRSLDTIVEVNGKYYHKDTGKLIIVANNLSADLNGVTNRLGSGVPVVFGVWNYFYAYTDGLRIDTSSDIYFDYDQTGFRFLLPYQQLLASQTKSAFVSLLGITVNLVPNT